MAGHTPGPWEVNAPGRVFVATARNLNAVCEVNTFERPHEVVMANAHVLAAAPELLAALDRLVSVCQSIPDDPELPTNALIHALAEAGTAIAKARGVL